MKNVVPPVIDGTVTKAQSSHFSESFQNLQERFGVSDDSEVASEIS